MSDTGGVVAKLQKLWMEKDLSISCPVCRSANLNIDTDAEIYIPTVIAAADRTGQKTESESQATYVLYCARCGFIMPFMRRIVDAVGDAPDAGEKTGE